ncbi:MAG: 3'-5' exonuclease [Chitinophagales bacterium]|nr:3'-5' exonuclease [Chitinophagales bacterium]
MYFFFDTETTGLPLNWNAPASQIDNWPRIIQVGYLLYDNNNQHIGTQEYIIKPKGFIIPTESSRIHGITTERALDEGVDLKIVLDELYEKIQSSSLLIAHNISFDEKVLGAEFLRNDYKNIIAEKKRFCTMQSSIDYCALPGKFGNYKWPKLEELHKKLFNKGFDNAHNALADIQATADCFWKMKEMGIIKV